jgi:hypothetical protein
LKHPNNALTFFLSAIDAPAVIEALNAVLHFGDWVNEPGSRVTLQQRNDWKSHFSQWVANNNISTSNFWECMQPLNDFNQRQEFDPDQCIHPLFKQVALALGVNTKHVNYKLQQARGSTKDDAKDKDNLQGNGKRRKTNSQNETNSNNNNNNNNNNNTSKYIRRSKRKKSGNNGKKKNNNNDRRKKTKKKKKNNKNGPRSLPSKRRSPAPTTPQRKRQKPAQKSDDDKENEHEFQSTLEQLREEEEATFPHPWWNDISDEISTILPLPLHFNPDHSDPSPHMVNSWFQVPTRNRFDALAEDLNDMLVTHLKELHEGSSAMEERKKKLKKPCKKFGKLAKVQPGGVR